METSSDHVREDAATEEADAVENTERQEDIEDKRKPFAAFIEKVALLFIGFSLTSLVGGYLANHYRMENARTDFELAAMQSDLSRSMQIFESISELMDKRLFRMRRLHDVYNGDITPDALKDRLAEYRRVFVDWNDKLNRYITLFKFYFEYKPDEQQERLEAARCATSFEEIASAFAEVHKELQKLIDKKSDGSKEKVKTMLNDLNYCVYGASCKIVRDWRGR